MNEILELKWFVLACPICFCLGFFLYWVIDVRERRHKEIKEEIAKDEKLEIIEEVFNEHGDCEHEVEGPSADYDGHHFISYSIDKKGKEKILEVL